MKLQTQTTIRLQTQIIKQRLNKHNSGTIPEQETSHFSNNRDYNGFGEFGKFREFERIQTLV